VSVLLYVMIRSKDDELDKWKILTDVVMTWHVL
jgi:hypothetical protein